MLQALDVSSQGEGSMVIRGSLGMAAQRFPKRLAGSAELTTHGRTLALAFHGSLYNLGELLALEGEHLNPFVCLLRRYLKEGIALVRRLRGEFAVALWDGRTETLHLATDRFRVQSLLYYRDSDKLVFASRMKSILACPFPMMHTIDPAAIVDVVASSVIPTPKTIFQEVRKLPGGHVLSYARGEIELAPYWDMDFRQADDRDEAELARQLKERMSEVISVRLAEDGACGRIGTFLSGGVDSSTMTGVLTQLTRQPVKSFSIGFDEAEFNEINYARIAARAFGSKHYEYFVTPQDTHKVIPIVLNAFDEPFANASAVPAYFCAKLAREQGVDVLYAGDGGDELFAGNERYATQRLFEYYHKIPRWVREPLMKPLVCGLADVFAWDPFVKGKKYMQRASIPYPERLSSYGVFNVIPMREMLDDALLQAIDRNYNPYEMVDFYYHRAPARSELDRQLYIDLKLAISDNDLFKVTRMTEAAGITTRFPFLDHHLAEFASRIPARIKMRGRKLRSFFKKAYADMLPLEVRTKPKHGFGLPIPVWLRTDGHLHEIMRDCVLSDRSRQRGFFRKQALEQLIAAHQTDSTSFYGTTLWNLTILELWFRQYGEPSSMPSVTIPPDPQAPSSLPSRDHVHTP